MDSSRPVTDAFFGLTDSWVDTAPGELTHYHDLGSGTPVVFLHGSGIGVSAAANWWNNLPVIAREHRALAPDLLGFGATVGSDASDYGVRAWVDHVLRWADKLELPKFWMVGNSLGGWVALQLAMDHPDRVAGLISMGTGGGQRSAVLRSHSAPEAVSADSIRRSLKNFVVDQRLVTEELVAARMRSASAPGAWERYAEVIKARERDRAAMPLDLDRLGGLDLPVLLVHGREDTVIPPARSWDLQQRIANADLLLLANCGHWSQVERADDFNSAVLAFIRKWNSR